MESTANKSTDYCEAQLLEMIRRQEIQPGVRLGEASLAKKLGVEKAMVAKAFERLVGRGLLVRNPRSGTYLRVASMDEFFDAVEVRIALEMLAVRRLASLCLEKEIDQLRNAALRIDGLQEKVAMGQSELLGDLQAADTEFHQLLGELAGNRSLIEIMENRRLIRYNLAGVSIWDNRRLAYHARGPRHIDIVDAIATGDGNYAGEVLRIHIQNGVNTLISCMTNQMPKFEEMPPRPTGSERTAGTTYKQR